MKTKNDNDLVTKLIEIIETAKEKGENIAMKCLYEIVMNYSMLSLKFINNLPVMIVLYFYTKF